MTRLHIDFETFGLQALPDVGLDIYTRPENEPRVMMCAYQFDNGPVEHWQESDGPFPENVRDALMDSSVEKWAFNASFERVVTNRVLGIPSPIKGWRCTMVLAYEQSFNGRLEDVGRQVGLLEDKRKANRGKYLINLFCGPQTVTKKQPHRIRDKKTDPELWVEFCEYNRQDVVAEYAIYKRLIKWNPSDFEWELYAVDQVINDRGFPVDLTFVRNAIAMGAKRKEELTDAMRDITYLPNPGSPKQLLPWLRERGYPFNDLQKESITKVLTVHDVRTKEGHDSVLTDDCVKVLRLRQWQARTSISKYDTLLLRCGPDGFMRYLFQFAGAGRTSRWAGRGVQTQNLPRTPKSISDVEILTAVTNIIRSGDYELLKLFIEEPMEALVGCVRSAFRVPEGYEFVVADLSSIETCVIAWLTACQGLLQALRSGLDPYIDFATRLFNVAYEAVTKAMRQICKPPVLGCGYRLGGGEIYDGKRTGLWGYAENMGVDMKRETAHAAVKLYRETYVEVPQAWKAIEAAVAECMRTGKPQTYGFLRFERDRPYLKMILPSGRPIYYMSPQMKMETIHTGRMVTRIAPKNADPGETFFMYGVYPGEEYEAEETYERLAFTYLGKHQKSNQWVRLVNHGGRFIEQSTQGFARDVFAVGMMRAHKTGFRLVAHAHDENIALQKIGETRLTRQRLEAVMSEAIAYAPGLPLGAAGYVSPFYRKE